MSVETDRAVALYHLRVNPKNRQKIKGYLTDGCNGRCAIGLIAEAFDIPIAPTRNVPMNDSSFAVCNAAFAQLEERLGIKDRIHRVWMWNDQFEPTTFAEVADKMEKELFNDKEE